MKALYLDTSVLVTAMTAEPETRVIQAWLAQRSEAVVLSDWTLVEFAGALSFKVRTGQLPQDEHKSAAESFARYAKFAEVSPVTRAHFTSAAILSGRLDPSLRPPDALHLGICAERDDILATRDRGMAAVAAAMGIETIAL